MSPTSRQSPAIPSARIHVIEPGLRPHRSDHNCLLGIDLDIDPELLSRYCLRDLDPIVDDLVLLAGAVAFTDRVVPRRPSIAWRRNLGIVVPVHMPEFWQRSELLQHLTSTLDYLTGDNWALQFKPRKHRTEITPQARLPLSSESSLVMPYSDGLDSFAGARLNSARHPKVPLILVTTGKRGSPTLDGSNEELGRLLYRVSIPFRLSRRRKVRFREPSYRSRAFVFGVMAGIAAHLLHASHVFIPESGQGSLGPWLMPVGNEAPDIRMHPSFTTRLAALLKLVLGSAINHTHPQLWKTKGETLSELKELGQSDGWWFTTSCARDARHVTLESERVQCGICAGCLLRRQSLLAARLDGRLEHYLWDDLRAPTLSRAVKRGSRSTVQNDERQALCAVLELQHFSEVTQDSCRVGSAVAELSLVMNECATDVESKLRRLISAHADEWASFLSKLGPASFANRWLKALK